MQRGFSGRKLLVEQLESRFALSTLTDVTVPLDTPNLTPDSQTPVLVGTVSTATGTTDSTAVGAADPPPDPSLATSTTNPTVLDPLGGGSTNLPPVIVSFGYSIVGDWCNLWGVVMDDQDPTGQPVQLTGLIFASPTVGQNDTFFYRFEWTPDMSGSIYANFQDMYGLSSNTAMITV